VKQSIGNYCNVPCILDWFREPSLEILLVSEVPRSMQVNQIVEFLVIIVHDCACQANHGALTLVSQFSQSLVRLGVMILGVTDEKSEGTSYN
jgi:hypothetical protein